MEQMRYRKRLSDALPSQHASQPERFKLAGPVQVIGLNFKRGDWNLLVQSNIMRTWPSKRKEFELQSKENAHQDHIADRGQFSMSHYNKVHEPSLIPKAMTMPEAEAAVFEEWTKLQKILAWDESKVTCQAEVIHIAKLDGKTVHFATFMELCHLRSQSWRKSAKSANKEWCFSVTHGGGKRFGRHLTMATRFWTSKWCRQRLHASQNARRTRTSSSFRQGLSNILDPHTESTKTTTLGLDSWSSGTAGAQSLRSPIGWILMGKKIRGSAVWTWSK